MGGKNSAHAIGQKRDETPSSRNETPSSPDRRTTRPLLIAATTRLCPPDVRSANESSVAQAGSSTNAATSVSSVAQADGASTSAVRPVIRNAVQSLVPLSPHRPSPGNCLREHRVSHGAFLITLPSGPPSLRCHDQI